MKDESELRISTFRFIMMTFIEMILEESPSTNEIFVEDFHQIISIFDHFDCPNESGIKIKFWISN